MEAMEVRISQLEKGCERNTASLQGLRESFMVNEAVQRGTNDRLDAHALEMKTSTGALAAGQVAAERRQDASDGKLDRLLGYFDHHPEHTDHGSPVMPLQNTQPAASAPGVAHQLNALDGRWVALVALALLIAGGTVSASLAESIWQWYAGAP